MQTIKLSIMRSQYNYNELIISLKKKNIFWLKFYLNNINIIKNYINKII